MMNRIRIALVSLPLLFAPALQAADGLEEAYMKEFAFLEAQKSNLQQRLKELKSTSSNEVRAAEREIDDLKALQFGLEARAEELSDQLKASNRQLEAGQSRQQLIETTLQQGDATLKEKGVELLQEGGPAEQLRGLFEQGERLLQRLSKIRSEQGRFFDTQGQQLDGALIHVGQVASYGISDSAAGMLVPAGGGLFKLWEEPAAATANALASGQLPEQLKIFLYENTQTSIDQQDERGVVETIDAGGVIAWVIVGLGALAVVLILLRVVFLNGASHDSAKIDNQVGELVRGGRLAEAVEAVNAIKGSTARVVAATLRNIDREREHLEDIISESILSEGSRLNRFGAAIIVIAAVSPLLGLLGTVTGMIATFDVITEFGTGDPKLLSSGISVALITTQLGLIVAIPALILGNLLTGWSNRIKDEMEVAALRIIKDHDIAQGGSWGRLRKVS